MDEKQTKMLDKAPRTSEPTESRTDASRQAAEIEAGSPAQRERLKKAGWRYKVFKDMQNRPLTDDFGNVLQGWTPPRIKGAIRSFKNELRQSVFPSGDRPYDADEACDIQDAYEEEDRRIAERVEEMQREQAVRTRERAILR